MNCFAAIESPPNVPCRSGGSFDSASADKELDQINIQMTEPGFWEDRERSQELGRRRGQIEAILSAAGKLEALIEETATLVELDGEGEDVDPDLTQVLDHLDDATDALLNIHPGAGGTESQDWAEMLYRMYIRWAERRGFDVQVLDYQDGEEAGLKSATALIRGRDAYGLLRAENGVHRLVRISPFDQAARRHTSFASVYSYPDIDQTIEIEIDEKDLRIDTFRSSGKGGQHVNVTDSAIRITHLPTGIVVQCQNERSQHRNREMATKCLKARLFEREEGLRREERAKEEGAKKEIGFGHQIRSYVLHPYRMVKDHRTGIETGKVDSVLDGDLDPFIKAFLLSVDRPRT